MIHLMSWHQWLRNKHAFAAELCADAVEQFGTDPAFCVRICESWADDAERYRWACSALLRDPPDAVEVRT